MLVPTLKLSLELQFIETEPEKVDAKLSGKVNRILNSEAMLQNELTLQLP